MKLSHANYSMDLDDRGNVRSISFAGGPSLKPLLPYTHYEVNGQPVRLVRSGSEGGFAAVDGAGADAGRFAFTVGREITVRPESAGAKTIESWSVTLGLPLDAEFHLPEYPNIGRKLDRTIPVADFYGAELFYNFLLVGCDGLWIRFLSEQHRVGRLGAHIERHDTMFLLTVTWRAGKDDAEGSDRFAFALDGRIAVFRSLKEAISDYDRYLEREVGVKPRVYRGPAADWVKTAPAMVHVDMMRCYGDVENDYHAVGNLARALERAGSPQDTVIHIVGFNGPFDSMYPTHRPVEELGGEAAFHAMVRAIHECGFRLSVHVDGCGIDPFHAEIDQLLPLVRRDKDGRPQGYKLAADRSPPSRKIRFHTDEIPLRTRDACSATVAVECPVLCESVVTIGGLGPVVAGRVSIAINGRTHRTPPGASLEEYRIPYPVHLDVGSNTIELRGESDVDWGRGWLRVESCFVPNSVHAIGTIPILMADTTRPEFITRFSDEIERLVTTYGIDLLYVDYTTFHHPNGSRKLFGELLRRLPDTPISVEWCDSLEELGWFAVTGGARLHLVKASPKLDELSGRKQIPVTRGIQERYGWLDVPSPVCAFSQRFTRFNGGGAFVPLNSVASLYPDRLVYADPTELREILDGAQRLNFVPMIGLNYRGYGVDEHAGRYLRELSLAGNGGRG